MTLARAGLPVDLSPSNLTYLATRTAGFSGSDLKEVCREAVSRVAHERAEALERGLLLRETEKKNSDNSNSEQSDEEEQQLLLEEEDISSTLRPVTMEDFLVVLKKMKASVDEDGRELQRVLEWNEKYGELKKNKRSGEKGGAGGKGKSKQQHLLDIYI